MPAITPGQLAALQRQQSHIRNLCILAHVDHGKTTLSDSLLASNGIISSKLAGKVRYLDSREDEQQRGITMQASAISLYFKVVKQVLEDEEQKRVEDEYLINLIDSPGHVDFSSEVSTASRLCDGALVLVDAVEGVCTQTITVLRQAWRESVRPVLVINKIDRLITELQLTSTEAYLHMNKILEQVNAITSSFFTGDLMEEESRRLERMKAAKDKDISASLAADISDSTESLEGLAGKFFDWSMEEQDDAHIFFDPSLGNVIFASAIDGWAFRPNQFASLYARKLGFKERILAKCLWGDYYFDQKAKKVLTHKQLKGRNLKPMFVQFCLDNIWAVYDSVMMHRDQVKVEKIIATLGLKILPRDLKSRDTKALLTAMFAQWLPLSTAVLLAAVDQIPSPSAAQRVRLPKMLYPNGDAPEEPSTPLDKALYTCDPSTDAPIVAYVSKMVAVPRESMPENRRVQLTADELRERGRLQRLQQQANDDAVSNGKVSLDASASECKVTEPAEASNETSLAQLSQEILVGFARLYSGTIKVGQTLHVLGPKYDPRYPDRHCSQVQVSSLYMIMGSDLQSLPEVPAGNVFGIGGLEGHILKNGTLTSDPSVRNLAGVRNESAPIVRVALEPEDPADMSKLVEGLKMLNQADPCVEVMIQETGEHVILTAGELHLERCLKDLRERFARCDIHVSPPIVPFRETIVMGDLLATADRKGETVQRGFVTIPTSNKVVTLAVRTIPLPSRITTFLTQRAATVRSIVEAKAAKSSKRGDEAEEDVDVNVQETSAIQADEAIMSPDQFAKALQAEFVKAEKDGDAPPGVFQDIVQKIWSLGPKRIGPNILVNRIPGYTRKPYFRATALPMLDDSTSSVSSQIDEDDVLAIPTVGETLSIADVDHAIQTGFQVATLRGPLCNEPVVGTAVLVEDVVMTPPSDENDFRSKIGIIQGQVISAMREACRQGFLDWSPRLKLAMYSCDIQATAEVLGRVYGVISKRRGRIIAEDLKEGTPFWQIQAVLPVVESFGFADEIRKRTSGAASPQLLFSGFEMLDQDPFWVPTTEEELEDLGEKADRENIARKYMDTVRKRKGLFVERKIIEHAEKQRTLRKN
ncbi:hypothetical protein BZG36_04304 [Bifiguratus adelaidae]|uniref:Ribosome assembly protein 1 n=1 Tax=Bifiguratus adelaidae TaxID=1938954 RepID=A0A261XZS0_9FUNG|nr:hypothetical protein BZG36_04304 [Bifiguratus adelaidae]